jgi:hypothetical protein
MPNSEFNLFEHFTSVWFEVFEESNIIDIPLDYVSAIRIEFTNGKIWEIDLDFQSMQNQSSFKEIIQKICSEYSNNILNLEFKINFLKLKIDVFNQVKKIL